MKPPTLSPSAQVLKDAYEAGRTDYAKVRSEIMAGFEEPIPGTVYEDDPYSTVVSSADGKPAAGSWADIAAMTSIVPFEYIEAVMYATKDGD